MFKSIHNHLKKERADKPQSYWEHGYFAAKHSLWIIWAGFAGIIHAINPAWFKFYTAEQVIRVYCALEKSGRHDDLIAKYKPVGYRFSIEDQSYVEVRYEFVDNVHTFRLMENDRNTLLAARDNLDTAYIDVANKLKDTFQILYFTPEMPIAKFKKQLEAINYAPVIARWKVTNE